MEKSIAIKKAGSIKALAELLGVTRAAISQWGNDVPAMRLLQLRSLRPEWFA